MAIITPTIKDITPKRTVGNPVFQCILVVIVLVIFSWFLVKPKLAQVSLNRKELIATQAKLDQVKSTQQELTKLVNKLHSSPDDVALLDEALPLNGRVSKVDVLLDNLVHASGMDLKVLTASDTQNMISAGDKEVLADPYKPGRALHTITINAEISGTMDQLKNFLASLETNGRVLDVDSLQITRGDPVTKFKITVKAYAYDNIEKAPGGAAAAAALGNATK